MASQPGRAWMLLTFVVFFAFFPMDSPRKRETAGRLINYSLAHVTLTLLGNFLFFCVWSGEGREDAWVLLVT